MFELAPTENWPAHILARTFSESQLSDGIAYLELVRIEELTPGPEMFRLGVSPLSYTTEELEAVQRKLALAISYQRSQREAA
jgi:hypothetical protein